MATAAAAAKLAEKENGDEDVLKPISIGSEEEAEAAPAESEDNESPFGLEGWYCEKCGSFNRGRTCSECGSEKPHDALQYVCDACGWAAPDPEHPPKFCPECGAPFAAADKKD